MKKKQQKNVWFVPVRGSYLPAGKAGWLTYIPLVSYCIAAPAFIYQEVGWGLVFVFTTVTNWLLAFMALTLVAQRKS